MFSKRTVIVLSVILLIALTAILIIVTAIRGYDSVGPGLITAPFQEITTRSIRFIKNAWSHYFFLVSTAPVVEISRLDVFESLRDHCSSKSKQSHFNICKLFRGKHPRRPHLPGGVYMNFVEGENMVERTPEAYPAETYQRLREIKTKYDPGNMLSDLAKKIFIGYNVPLY